ncbi:MAG: hypothetical protein ACE5LV_08900 [Candidatus Aminicenantales bacterium]
MFRCGIFRILIRFVPFKTGKGLLIQAHVERCPDCQRELAGPKDARTALLEPPEAFQVEEFWASAASRTPPEKGGHPEVRPPLVGQLGWKSVAFAGIFVLLFLAGYVVFRNLGPSPQPREKGQEETFAIHRLRVRGKPADPIIYRPHRSNIIFVWGQVHEKHNPQ